MKTSIILSTLCALLLSSCATIPMQTVALNDSIMVEGKRMHNLNIMLTNKLFNEKRLRIDDFIKNTYTPTFINQFVTLIPSNVDIKQELPSIISSIIPMINQRRDSMQNALEVNRIKITDKLNQDYLTYIEACSSLKRLLESSIKVDNSRKQLLNRTTALTGSPIDFDKIEKTIDRFITKAGNVGQNITDLNDDINKLISK